MSQQLLTTTDPQNYLKLLSDKVSLIYSRIQESCPNLPEPVICASSSQHYRMRAEFSIYLESDCLHYVMYKPKVKPRERIFVDNFTPAYNSICSVMPNLAKLIPQTGSLKDKLFEIDFLTNQKGELIISLIYHRVLDEEQCLAQLKSLRNKLTTLGHSASLVAHAKNQIIKCPTDTLLETYKLKDTEVSLYQVEGTFTQPNAKTCCAMLEFARDCSVGMHDSDLLELYCGSGTFTTAISPLYRKVLATEVSRTPTQTALKNLNLNNITNTKLVRLSALEVAQALNHERSFNRLSAQDIDLNLYNFRTLLIDPPRAGLASEEALRFTAGYERIIYISCGPESFVSDLAYLSKTHDIVKLSFFDQFPYTEHLESGALLIKR